MLHISTLTGKMENIPSISTNPKSNPSCLKNRKVKGSICEKCYSFRALSYRRNLENALEKNTKALTVPLLPNQIPFTNYAYFRFESHGDVINAQHLDNLVKIARHNPRTTFTLWSKNFNVVNRYFDKHEKPKNFILIFSSLKMNTPVKPGVHADKVFTVYDKEFPTDNINCAGKCSACLKCYRTEDRTTFINERVHR